MSTIHSQADALLHPEVHRLVRGIPDDHYSMGNYTDHYQHPQLLVLGLGSPSLVQSEMHRLGLSLRTSDDVRGWIAQQLAGDALIALAEGTYNG